MLKTANLEYIDSLYHIGQQLAVLKRIYEGYKNIIDRMLDGQKSDSSTTTSVPAMDQTPVQSTDTLNKLTADKSTTRRPGPHPTSSSPPGGELKTQFGPTLTPAATARFERLRDRIKLYVLSEIQDCLDEKEAMAMMVSVRWSPIIQRDV